MKSTSTEAPPITTNGWFKLVWIFPVALVLLLAVVLIAQWLSQLPAVQSFMTEFPGESHLSESAPVGFPAWLGWQHFLNTFLILLIIRSGWMVRTNQRPAAYWTRENKSLIRTKNPPTKISLDLWFHLSLGLLWVLNGIVFYVFIFTTGQWMRLVPTSWDVFPNALSTAIHYASLNWPTENGWVNYNSLQLLAYFTTVFIATALAVITGIRVSGAWPAKAKKLSKLYPVVVARAIHFPRHGLLRPLHHRARYPGYGHRCSPQPQPHVFGAQRHQLGRILDLRGFTHYHHRRLDRRPTPLPSPHRSTHRKTKPTMTEQTTGAAHGAACRRISMKIATPMQGGQQCQAQ